MTEGLNRSMRLKLISLSCSCNRKSCDFKDLESVQPDGWIWPNLNPAEKSQIFTKYQTKFWVQCIPNILTEWETSSRDVN